MRRGLDARMEPALVKPRGIIFDWDNTLVDSWGCIGEALNRTLSAMGHAEWGMEQIKSRVALSLRDSFPALFGDRWTEARDIFYAAFEAIHLDYLKPLPGAAEMLRSLGASGVRLSVVSNKNGGYLRQEAARLGWQPLFDRLVGAHDAPRDKPAAPPVLLAMESMGCESGDPVWFVGDAAVDMECAANTGCVPVLLRCEPPRPGEFDGFPFRHRLENCAALSGLVSEL
ncbi:HAD family hydrolase [Telmatospirillum siberiense]|uniref:HAD family hydrolase n=1 Tax=Telmatospirillum siberiense TaxID=382514 RepID=UPI0026C4584C